jgi:hypothetical protein
MDQLKLTAMEWTQIWSFSPFENVYGKIKFVRSFGEKMKINFAIFLDIISADVTVNNLYKFARNSISILFLFLFSFSYNNIKLNFHSRTLHYLAVRRQLVPDCLEAIHELGCLPSAL